MKAAIHLGPNYNEILEVYKNTNFEEIQSSFGVTQKLILDHPEEILNVLTNWKYSSLHGRDLHCLMIKWSSGPKQQYALTLRLCSMPGEGVSSFRSKPMMGMPCGRLSIVRFIRGITGNRWRTNWVRVEYCPRTHIITDSSEDPEWFFQEQNIEPEKFGERIIFMLMFNDMEWTRKKETQRIVFQSDGSQDVRGDSRKDSGRSSALETKRKWYGNCNYKPEGKWNSIASQMVQRFKETSHPVFISASASSRGILRKLRGKETIHFNADASNTELFFRIIHSVNQLSIHGAVSNWCEGFNLRPNEREPTSEKFAAKENSVNEEIRKSVPESGNRLRECLQNFESRSKTSQLTKVCELASFWLKVEAGMRTMVLGDVSPICREFTFPRTKPRSRAYTVIPGKTVIETVIEVHVVQLLGRRRLEIKKISLRIIQTEHPGLWYAEERIDLWTNCISQIQDTISPVRKYYRNKQLQKKVNLVLQNWNNPALKKLVRDHSGLLLIQCTFRKEFSMKEKKWKSIPACPSFKGKSLSTAISKLVTRLVRHYDQEERETDGAVHWNATNPKLLRAFGDKRARKFSDKDWLQQIDEGSDKTSVECCENSKDSLMYIRAIQGHTDGSMIVPELMGHVTIPYNWKEFVFHWSCSFNINSILGTRLVAGRRESKEGRQKIFFTPLKPFGENPDQEAPGGDLSISRKAHYHRNLKHDQDAVCWVKLSRAQDQGLRFWQTKSNAIIVHNPVPGDSKE